MEKEKTLKNNEDEPPDSSPSTKRKILLQESSKLSGSFFVEKQISINPEIRENGIELNLNGIPFSIVYPKSLWEKYPPFSKKILSENLAFALTLHLPYLVNIDALNYQMTKPVTKEIITKGFQLSLPSTALMKSQNTSELLEKFSKVEYRFNGENNLIINNPFPASYQKYSFGTKKNAKNIAILPFTFGKDSLLTYSLCREIGIETVPVYVKEPLTQWENYHKEKLAKRFFDEFGEKILFLDNKAGKLREAGGNGWFGWELQLTQFGLMLLPVIFSKRAQYVFFANEQSCNDRFLNNENFWCNPVYEQSAEWTLKLEEMTQSLGIEELKVGSLVEPLYEIAIIKILYSRYPKIAKYQMSCGENTPELKHHRWCGNCSKCARIYILFLANNINPKKMGMPNNMLELKYRHKFSLFNGNENGYGYGYDKSRLGRDEQLLAFLLAYRHGYKGELINLFKKLFLKEAKEREKELREKFFGIHSADTIPKELKDDVLSIFKKELKGLK